MTRKTVISKPISQFKLVEEKHGTKNLIDDKWILEIIRKATEKSKAKGGKQ